MRAAWIVRQHLERVRSAPHQPVARLARRRRATRGASRFTCAFSSANVVVDAVAPPLSSTTTATFSGDCWAWTARASSGAFMRGSRTLALPCRGHLRCVVSSKASTGRRGRTRRALDALEFLAPRGMNAYVYAPKDDAEAPRRLAHALRPRRTRAVRRARAAIGRERRAVRLRDLARPRHHVRVGRRPRDVDGEARAAARRGHRMVLVARRRHSDASRDSRRGRRPSPPGCTPSSADAAFTVCPTEYVGTRPSPYLSELGAGMPPEIDIMWTGPTVCSPHDRAPATRSDGPTRSAAGACSCGTTIRSTTR